MNDQAQRLTEETADRFEAEYGAAPKVVGTAPGRVNIIGEHTDYSGGFVLPAALPLYTCVAVGPGRSARTRVLSTALGRAAFPPGDIRKRGRFDDYLAGAVQHAGLSGLPLDLLVHGTLPTQAGLSSSASLLVAAIAALGDLSGAGWNRMEIALAAREVENTFVGVPCGFMDQFAAACAVEGKALLLDCLDNSFVEVPAALPGHRWLVVYSGLRRELASGGYKARVDALKRAVDTVAQRTGLPPTFLRAYSQEDVGALAAEAGLARMETDLMKHVCAENHRVHAMRWALERGCPSGTGALLNAGHWSLSRLFGVSTPDMDSLVRFSCMVPGVAGMRLTGAGMGGSLVALVAEDAADQARERIRRFVQHNLSPDGDVYSVPAFSGGSRTWKP